LRAICFHGHFYQPQREDPWLGVIEPEPSAAPDRDWNARIARECYVPAAAARILDAAGRLRDLVNIYEWASFNVGPTLLAWLELHCPEVLRALQRADAASRARTGHGNAWAQPYGHPILPLSSPRDVRTQVIWGRRDFEHRFGRAAEGMWLPEMAVDLPALAALVEAGIGLTMLAPHQARRVRPLGAAEDAWVSVTPETLDSRRLYRCALPGGRTIDILFRHAAISQEIGFGPLLRDGAALAARLRAALAGDDAPALVTVAVDGETFGHHHRFGEMALAFALRALAQDPAVAVVNPAAFREAQPPAYEVEIIEGTSWSCPHGVERWRADCGCRVAGPGSWNQAWRAPLRQAIDWLRDELAVVYQTRAGEVLRDPWGARDRYVSCVLEPGRTGPFIGTEATGRLSPAETVQARRALELARHALLMQTSCGWFFNELTGVEPALILRHAARAIELAEGLGRRLEEGFVQRLEPARSNLPDHGSGADVYRRLVRGAAPTAARVAATGALLALIGQPARVPGYEIAFSAGPAGDRLVADARVAETSTGAAATVPVLAERPPGAAPWCRAGETTFTLADLFGIQRERVLDAVGREAGGAARAGRRAALAQVRPLLDPLLAGTAPLPFELAVLMGYEEAEAIANALEARAASLRALVMQAQALRTRGVIFPARWLAGRIARVLDEKLGGLPERAEDALMLLDLAAAAGVTLDLASAQVRMLAWWKEAPPTARAQTAVATVYERLHLASELV